MIALGSFLLSCLVLLTLIIVQTVSQSPFSILTLLLVPLITGSISFVLFWFIVERFINKKIKGNGFALVDQRIDSAFKFILSFEDDFPVFDFMASIFDVGFVHLIKRKIRYGIVTIFHFNGDIITRLGITK